ncbi:MAG: hypothetical protein WA751_06625 [Candidatus Dormiibacterota bacterium]
MIWLFLALVLVAHEASHALALWAFRIRFAPRVWYSRDFPWLGFGWMYLVDGIDPRQRHTILVVGPIVEAILWSLGALLFPEYFLGLILMAGATLLMNRFVPGGDLWKAQRLPKTAQSVLAAAGHGSDPRGLPAPSSEG